MSLKTFLECCFACLNDSHDAKPTIVQNQQVNISMDTLNQNHNNQYKQNHTSQVYFKNSSEIPFSYFQEHKVLIGICTSITDGDTFKFYHGNTSPSQINQLKYSTFTVRLASIDCPEIAKQGKQGQPFGQEARQMLSSLIHKKVIKLELFSIDQYERVLARVVLGDMDVGLTMIKKGLADVYKGKGVEYGNDNYKKMMFKCLEEAKMKKVGIWSQKTIISPAEYKRMNKQFF